jgi:hypothetical protein
MQTDTATGQRHLVHCGSCSLTPAQRNYAVIELEAIAVQWAIQKCRFFLLGAPLFHVKTDHKPLVGVFAKNIVETDNPRLLRVREKTSPYSFTVSWIQGKDNVIADALSRRPVFSPDPDLNCGPVLRSITASISAVAAGPNLATMRDTARADRDYADTLDAIAVNAIPNNPVAASLASVWPRLSADDGLIVLDGHRLVPPPACPGPKFWHSSTVVTLVHKKPFGMPLKRYSGRAYGTKSSSKWPHAPPASWCAHHCLSSQKSSQLPIIPCRS